MEERITTAGLVIEDGKVLVAKRQDGGALSGKWEFPGGKNRYGESISDTLKREWKEELSVDIEAGEEVLSFDFENKGKLYHQKVVLVSLVSRNFVLSVHTDIAFVSKEELEALDMGESDSTIRSFVLSKIL